MGGDDARGDEARDVEGASEVDVDGLGEDVEWEGSAEVGLDGLA